MTTHEPNADLRSLPPVLVYHKIDFGFELGVNIVSPRAFARQMSWIAARGLAGISLADALAGRAPARASVVLTFDDGYESVARHALPVLADLGFRASVFVPSAQVGTTSSWDTRFLGRRYAHLDRRQVRALAAAGWEIGSHSATHADLRRVSRRRLEEETAGSRAALEDLTGAAVLSFAYPFGRTDARVRAAVVAAGYRVACGAPPVWIPRPGLLPRGGGGAAAAERGTGGRLDPLAIPRLGVRAPDGLGALRAKIEGGRGAFLEHLKEAVAHGAAGGTPWAKSWLPFS